jgi:hypothetical protein
MAAVEVAQPIGNGCGRRPQAYNCASISLTPSWTITARIVAWPPSRIILLRNRRCILVLAVQVRRAP